MKLAKAIKWGGSVGITFKKADLRSVDIHIGDWVSQRVIGNQIIIERMKFLNQEKK